MRKPLRPGKRFAAEPRVVGKNSRAAAEQTGSGKRGRARGAGSRAGHVGDRGGRSGHEGGLGDRSAQRSGFGDHAGGGGAPGEADRQMRSRALGGAAMCVTRARVAPRAGAGIASGRRRGLPACRRRLPAHGGGGRGLAWWRRRFPWWWRGLPWRGRQTSVRLVLLGVYTLWVRSDRVRIDGCCTSNASTMSDERQTGPVSDSRHRSP